MPIPAGSADLAWPPSLEELKDDLGIDDGDTRDDARLLRVLDSSVAFVQRVRSGFNYDADPESTLPEPTEDLRLGTIRLAGRWHTRRRSPDGLIEAGEFGTTRVPSFDPDIERLLGIGRYAPGVFA